MDNDGILVLGATNIPWVLDSAIRRRYVFISDLFLSDFNRKLTAVRGIRGTLAFGDIPI